MIVVTVALICGLYVLRLNPVKTPAPSNIEQNTTALTGASSAALEPVQLRAINWLDQVHNKATPGWLPTGEPVSLSEELPDAGGSNDKSPPGGRFLALWFSHPLFDKQSQAKLTFLDHTGAPLSSPQKALLMHYQTMTSDSTRKDGWMIAATRLSGFDNSPKNLLVRLDYSLGTWTYTKEIPVTPHITQTKVLTDGTVVGLPSQNAAGKAFIETSFNPKSVSQVEQLDFVAITHDGRRLNRTSGTSQGYDQLHTKRFVFDIPLSEVRAFGIRTRPIRTTEWAVPLSVNKSATAAPIELRAINWLDHAEGDVGQAWQPTGENTSNSERRPSHIGITSSAPTSPLDGDAPRYLCLWFTHPGLDSSSLVSVKLLDPKNHHSLSPLGSHSATGFHPAANGNPPWIMATVAAGLFDRMPSQASVVLTYAVGEWCFWTELPLDTSARRALVTGVSVSPPGQGSDGQAFIEITRDRAMDTYVEQFGFVALTRDGRRLESKNRSDYTTGGTLTQRFHFDAPLEQLRAIEVRRRGITGSTWTVPLRPERILSDERSLHLDRAGDTMANIVMRLRREHGLRLAFEDLEFNPAEGVTLGTRLVELEAKEARHRLHSAEVRLLRDARLLRDKNKLAPQTLIDVGERFYGTIRGRNTADFLQKLTDETPYLARRVHGTWVIEPRSASRLTYPVTLDTAGLTVERALAAILAQSPQTAPLLAGPTASSVTSTQPIDRQPWLHVQAPALRFQSTPAAEALARFTESAVPASVWTVGGYSDRRVVTLAPAPADPSLRRIQECNTWLLSIDRGLYAESWHNAGQAFKTALTAQAWSDALHAARTPLGDARSRRLISVTPATALPGVPDGRYLVLIFASSFAHKQAAVETLSLSHEPDGVWRPIGYFIK